MTDKAVDHGPTSKADPVHTELIASVSAKLEKFELSELKSLDQLFDHLLSEMGRY